MFLQTQWILISLRSSGKILLELAARSPHAQKLQALDFLKTLCRFGLVNMTLREMLKVNTPKTLTLTREVHLKYNQLRKFLRRPFYGLIFPLFPTYLILNIHFLLTFHEETMYFLLILPLLGLT